MGLSQVLERKSKGVFSVLSIDCELKVSVRRQNPQNFENAVLCKLIKFWIKGIGSSVNYIET